MAEASQSTSALDAIVLMKNLTIKAFNITTKVNISDSRSGDQFSRLWYYQTCTEFGWYQTCTKGSNCPWTQGYNTAEWNLKPCQLLFGISPEQVQENIRKTNEFYKGILYPNTTRTIFPNGEVDPWHWESVLEHPNPEIETIFIKGASHCEWMTLGLRVQASGPLGLQEVGA
ncbi:Prss16 [Symbiodinium sp. CCMP2456]|nr:Prss16 [Symbiodinium sp. CCMP2456]